MEALLARVFHSSPSQRLTDLVQMRQELSRLIASPPIPTLPSASPPPEKVKIQTRQHPFLFWKGKRGILVGLTSLVVLLSLIFIFSPLLTGKFSAPANVALAQQALSQKAFNQELDLELQTYRTKHGIGLSDGRLVFDTYPGRTKADLDLKQQAASALQQGNIRKASDFLIQASAADPADGEAQIYHEDLRVLESGAPFISIVIGLIFDRNPTFLLKSRLTLESAYLAQNEINTKGLLPHHLQVRLLIDNPGRDGGNVATVTQFIANRVTKAGNPITLSRWSDGLTVKQQSTHSTFSPEYTCLWCHKPLRA